MHTHTHILCTHTHIIHTHPCSHTTHKHSVHTCTGTMHTSVCTECIHTDRTCTHYRSKSLVISLWLMCGNGLVCLLLSYQRTYHLRSSGCFQPPLPGGQLQACSVCVCLACPVLSRTHFLYSNPWTLKLNRNLWVHLLCLSSQHTPLQLRRTDAEDRWQSWVLRAGQKLEECLETPFLFFHTSCHQIPQFFLSVVMFILPIHVCYSAPLNWDYGNFLHFLFHPHKSDGKTFPKYRFHQVTSAVTIYSVWPDHLSGKQWFSNL